MLVELLPPNIKDGVLLVWLAPLNILEAVVVGVLLPKLGTSVVLGTPNDKILCVVLLVLAGLENDD